MNGDDDDLPYRLSESDLQTVQSGAMAHLGYQAVQPHLDQQFGVVIERAVNLFRANQLSPQEAYTAIGQLTAILDVRAALVSAIEQGEAVAQRIGPGLDSERRSTVEPS